MSLTNYPNGITSFGLPITPMMGVGNVYYVCQFANTNAYTLLSERFGGEAYTDGTQMLHTTIQSALNATKANRNDYVLVTPDSSDYDLTTALTMSKARTHLIAPAGLGYKGFPPNAIRVHQTGSYSMITVTADTIEIAGFFYKGARDENIIDLDSTRWHPHIHDNFFGMSSTDSSDNSGIQGAGAVSHASIHDNYFTNYEPGVLTGTDNDLDYFIDLSSASCTRNLIRDNYFVTGLNTEVTSGIREMGEDTIIDGNVLQESVGSGGTQDGLFTKGITSGVNSMVTRNMFAMAADNEVTGGTTDESYTNNFEATSGGTKVT